MAESSKLSFSGVHLKSRTPDDEYEPGKCIICCKAGGKFVGTENVRE